MTLVKICGITRPEDARLAVEAGATWVGVIFARESRRKIDDAAAKEVRAALNDLGHGELVGVFVNEDPARINRLCRDVGLDRVQLHGDESDVDIERIVVPVIRAIRVGAAPPEMPVGGSPGMWLFDTADASGRGGTGKSFDWKLLDALQGHRPFLLSGGLDPENVADAIRRVRPDGVDVASGIESSPGIKDHDKLRAFIREVKNA